NSGWSWSLRWDDDVQFGADLSTIQQFAVTACTSQRRATVVHNELIEGFTRRYVRLLEGMLERLDQYRVLEVDARVLGESVDHDQSVVVSEVDGVVDMNTAPRFIWEHPCMPKRTKG
ncbi:hypothetical protein EGW08_023094, partial [Elysia chlorotica]